jgi:surfeit locus 1 family protein
MRFGRYVFKPSLIPTLAAILFAGLTASLGNWQLNRAEEKRVKQDQFDRMHDRPATALPAQGVVDKEKILFSKVRVQGHVQGDYQIYIDNRVHDGQAGYHVIVPLEHAPGRFVLVNRGWLPRGDSRKNFPHVEVQGGEWKIEGIAVSARSRYLELGAQTVEGRVWQNLDMDRFESWFPGRLEPILILQTNDTGDSLSRDWPRPDTGIQTHMGYAFQWFALCTAIIATYLVTNVKRIPAT